MIDRSPARASTWIALTASSVCVLSIALWHWLGLLLTLFGFGCVVFGLVRRSRTLLGAGVGWFTIAAVFGVVIGVPTELVLVAMVCAVLAWDAGQRALTLGEQLGQEATTTRLEVLHTAASGFVGVVTLGLTVFLSSTLSFSYPIVSILLVSGGVVVLLFAQKRPS